MIDDPEAPDTGDSGETTDTFSGKILAVGVIATLASCLAPPGYAAWGLAGLAVGLLGWAGVRMRV